jgi:hypothetical protein
VCVIVAGCGYAPQRTALEDDAAIADVSSLADAGVDADPPDPPAALHLYVEAKIDGRSNLIIRGTTVTWMHFQFAAPGRETFTNVPTMLDAVAWQPVWPDVPNAENRDCNCMSSTFDALPVALPAVPSTVTVTHVKGRRTTTPSAIELPTSANNFTLVLEFTDVGLSGSDQYGANIDVVPN